LAHEVGVSNYSLDQIDELETATGNRPAVNQIKWGPARYDQAIVDGHADRGVVLEGYSPFKTTDLSDSTLTSIADRYRKTAPQIVLRWHLDHGFVAIPKSARADRIAANFDVRDFSLTPEEVAAIDALGRAPSAD
jgi:diketogulonate reductase-like aldo/keto reductase